MRQEKKIKDIQIGRKEVKLSLFADNWHCTQKTLRTQKTKQKKKIKQLLEPINELNTISGYKINIQKTCFSIH